MMQPPIGDVVVFGSVRWDQPSLTEHHLARALARRTRVLYVDPPQSLLTPLRERRDGRSLAKIVRLARAGTTEDLGVQVLQPAVLPPLSHPAARRMSAPLQRRQLASTVRQLGMAVDVVVTTRTLFEGLPAELLGFVVAVEKDWTRAGGHLTGVANEATRRSQLDAWSSADLLCATSTRLRDRIEQEGFPASLLRHGFDVTSSIRFEEAHAAPGLVDLPRPVLGCVGRIDDRWSFSALADLARANPTGSVVLIGPVNPRVSRAALDPLLAMANVHQFPAVDEEQLPDWLCSLDCCLIPYKDDDWQRYASPLKIWDYLAAGRPIAATGCPAMGEFPAGLVAYAADPSRLSELVETALAADDEAVAHARRQHAKENSWDRRVDELLGLIAATRSRTEPERAA